MIIALKSAISFLIYAFAFNLNAEAIKIRPHHVNTAVRASSNELTSYYYTPMGLTFEGADKDEQFGKDLAYAPISYWLETKAEVSKGTPQWSYPVGVNSNGSEKMGYSTQEELNFRMTSKGKFSAPVLTASNDNKTVSYTVAKDSILYGSLGDENHFAVNYRSAETLSFDTADELLTCNSKDADEQLNLMWAMAGGLYSDFKIKGFAESFYYVGDFWLQAIGVEVSSKNTITADSIALTVYEREKTSVKDKEIGNFYVADVHKVHDNRYYVTFKPNEPIFVTTAMQILVHSPEGKLTQFAPVIPSQKSYHPSNGGNASLYGDFKVAGHQATNQYCDFYDMEMEDENGNKSYLSFWNVGVFGSYDKPGTGNVPDITNVNKPISDGKVYTLDGKYVSNGENVSTLPSGIYIVNGKKIIK